MANLLSILNLLFGFAAVVFSLEGYFTLSSWAIIFSVCFDGFDGELARKNNNPTEFGRELDSLADVVSFGVAPSILGYSFIYQRASALAAIILFLYLLCSVLRLARYNVTPKEKLQNYFYGLPTTVAGGILASFILICRQRGVMVFTGYTLAIFLSLVLLLAFLMVSRLGYLNLDGLKQFLGKGLKLMVFILALILIAALYLNKIGIILFELFLIYLIFSPFVVKRLNNA